MTPELLIAFAAITTSLALLTKNIRHLRCCCLTIDQDTQQIDDNLQEIERLVQHTRTLTPRVRRNPATPMIVFPNNVNTHLEDMNLIQQSNVP